MKKTLKTFAILALASIAVLFLTGSTAHAQRRQINIPQLGTPGNGVDTVYWVTPYMTLNQLAYNTTVMGKALQNVPPYALGYNPYPQIINIGPSYPTQIYRTPGYPVPVNPYGYPNPALMNPYRNPFNPYLP